MDAQAKGRTVLVKSPSGADVREVRFRADDEGVIAILQRLIGVYGLTVIPLAGFSEEETQQLEESQQRLTT